VSGDLRGRCIGAANAAYRNWEAFSEGPGPADYPATPTDAIADAVIPLVEQATAERIADWLEARQQEIPRDYPEGVAARVELAAAVVALRSGVWQASAPAAPAAPAGETGEGGR